MNTDNKLEEIKYRRLHEGTSTPLRQDIEWLINRVEELERIAPVPIPIRVNPCPSVVKIPCR